MRRDRTTGPVKVSIVVPVLNEARNLEVILPKLPAVHQVVLVDGRSTDDTVATARRVMPDITVVTQTRRGKGNALACGFEASTGDIIVMFDADCSADPAEIPAFVDALVAGADFAKGTRYAHQGGSHDLTLLRSMGNRGLNGLANVLMGTRYTDLCYGYNAFWRDILPALNLPSSRGAHHRPRRPPVGRRLRDRNAARLPGHRGRPARRRGPECGAAPPVRREQPQHLGRRGPGAAHDHRREAADARASPWLGRRYQRARDAARRGDERLTGAHIGTGQGHQPCTTS